MKWLRKNLWAVLIVMGISMTIISIITAYKWRYNQDELISEYESQYPLPDALKTESTMITEDIPYIEVPEVENNWHIKNDTKESTIKRAEYKNGDMMIFIPKIEVKAAIMDGTTKAALKEGPGLYEISPLPNEDKGNVCIAGHRTTYGAWFRRVDELEEGDEIVLEIKGESYTYAVEKVFIVAKNDWSVTEPTDYSAITLTACHPLHSSRQRIVVRGRLTI